MPTTIIDCFIGGFLISIVLFVLSGILSGAIRFFSKDKQNWF